MKDNPKQRFEVLDSFRGLAAMFVVVHHMHFVGSISELSFFKHSFLFVEFFFILSGFVLAHGYASKENLQFKSYFIARTFRIFPLHLIVLFAFILFELLKLWIHLYVLPLTTVPFEQNMSPSEILPNMFLLQAWLPFSFTIGFNPPAWSISIEYYMYMMFFVTLLFKDGLKVFIWFSISILMFYLILIDFNIDKVILRGLSSFFLGVMVYSLYKKFHTKISFSSLKFSILEGSLLLLVIILISIDIPYKAFIINILFGIQVFIFSFARGIFSHFFKHKLFLLLGTLSYSIYMIHVFIIFSFLWLVVLVEKIWLVELTPMIGDTAYIDFGSSLTNNILILFLLLLIIFIAKYTYRYIEVKGQKWGKRINKSFS